MGILTNLIDDLASGALRFGFNQLDRAVTQDIQQGYNERALQKVDQWENQTFQNYQLANKLQSGQYNMPGTGLIGGAMDPNSPAGQAAMASFSGVLPIPKEIANSPLASQLMTQQYADALRNNPYYMQQELAQKMAETGISAAGTAAGTLGGQGILGNQDINPYVTGSRAFSASQIQKGKGDVAGGITEAQEAAKEPGRIAASQRALFNKQQPGARAAGTGFQGNTISPAFISSSETQILKYPQYRNEVKDAYGISVLDKKSMPVYQVNERGQRVNEIVTELTASQKKPNYAANVRKAIAQETKEFRATQNQQKQAETQSSMQRFQNLTPEQSARLKVLQERNQQLNSPAPLSAPQQTQPQPAQPTQPQSAIQPGGNQNAQVKSVIQTKLQSQTPQQVRTELQATYLRKLKESDPSAEYFNPANYPELQ